MRTSRNKEINKEKKKKSKLAKDNINTMLRIALNTERAIYPVAPVIINDSETQISANK